MLRIMKNEFSLARFASCPKDASYCASNASFFISSAPGFYNRGLVIFPFSIYSLKNKERRR
jgi:hypothetical protein